MPDLRARLEGAAAGLRSDRIPPFSVIEKRARLRRQRIGLAAAGSVLSLGLIATSAAGLVDDGAVVLQGPAAPPSPSTGERAWPTGATEEPRPFAVPTTDPAGHIIPTHIGDVAANGVSVPWVLTRIWDGGRRFGVNHELSCTDASGGDVRVLEAPEWVLVQALSAPDTDGRRCLRDPGRAVVQLRDPLGDRPLLHARIGDLGDPVDPRSLAERFEDPPTWPGEPWHRNGHPASRQVLVLSEGPEHCNWETAAVLAGSALAQDAGVLYWRDPKGALEHAPELQREFRAGAELPADAAWTGWTQRGAELWTAPSDEGRYVYLVRAAYRSDVERWVKGFGGCA